MHQIGPGMLQQVQKPCNKCNGTGIYIEPKDKCKISQGTGLVHKEKKVTIPLRRGISHGQKIEIEGKGNQSRESSVRSNLIIVIMEKEDEKFKRMAMIFILK